jgi:hypothetical protein
MAKNTVKRKSTDDSKTVARLKELKDLLAHKRSDLKWHHAVGRLVAQFVPTKAAYGEEKMPALLDLLGISANKEVRAVAQVPLYAARNFYLKYKNGLSSLKGLEYGHASILAGIKDERIRAKYQGLCQEHEWSLRELRARIQEDLGKRSLGGRKFGGLQKVGPRASLLRILWLRKAALNRCVPALEQNLERLAKRVSRRPDDKLVSLVDATCTALDEMLEAVRDVRTKLKKVKQTSMVRR